MRRSYLSQNEGLKAKEILVQSKEESIKLEKAKLLPRVGVHLEYETLSSDIKDESEKFSSIYGELNLFNGFKDQASIERSRNSALIAKESLSFTKLRSLKRVEMLFYKFKYLDKKLRTLKKEQKRSLFHQRLVEKRLASGLVTETDLFEFKLYLNKLNTLIEYTELEQVNIYNQLFLLVGLDPGHKNEIVGDIPHLHIETKLSELLNSAQDSPAVRLSDLKVQDKRITTKYSKSNWLPRLDLKAEYGKLDDVETGISPEETSSQISLSVKWELYSGGESVADSKISRLNELASIHQKRNAQTNYRIAIERNFNALMMLEKSIDQEERNLKLAKKLYRMTLKEYKKGVKDSGALLSASKDISESEGRVFELKLNYVSKKLNLEELSGKVLSFKTISH